MSACGTIAPKFVVIAVSHEGCQKDQNYCCEVYWPCRGCEEDGALPSGSRDAFLISVG